MTRPSAALFLLVVLLIVGTHAGRLVFFDTDNPSGSGRTASVDLSGLDSDEEVIGLDYRPANGRLYLVTSMNRIYDVENPSTGTATIVSTITGCTLSGATFGVDFNPVVDRLRIVSNTGNNYRIDVVSGSCTIDLPLDYAVNDTNDGDVPAVSAVAYTNNLPSAPTTTLYGIDHTAGVLVTILPPNNGTLNTVGALGLASSDVITGFDILSSSTNPATGAYVVYNNADGESFFAQVNLTTGGLGGAVRIGSRDNLIGLTIPRIPQGVSYTSSKSAAVVSVPMIALVFAIISLFL